MPKKKKKLLKLQFSVLKGIRSLENLLFRNSFAHCIVHNVYENYMGGRVSNGEKLVLGK